MGFRGGEEKFHIFWGLFQGLEEGVPGAGGEHVDFVDDIDFILAFDRGIEDLVSDAPHVINAVMAGRIDFNDVQGGPCGNFLAGIALAAGFAVNGMFAVERLCENTRAGGFADSPGAHK